MAEQKAMYDPEKSKNCRSLYSKDRHQPEGTERLFQITCGQSNGIMSPSRSSSMGSLALLQSLKESVLGQASVKAIYGEPISAHEKTIIPVAKIVYGYGAGAGTGGVGEKNRGEGGGGAGGVRAIPIGVIEVSKQQTRFVPITDRKKLSGAVLAGMALGMFWRWQRRR